MLNSVNVGFCRIPQRRSRNSSPIQRYSLNHTSTNSLRRGGAQQPRSGSPATASSPSPSPSLTKVVDFKPLLTKFFNRKGTNLKGNKTWHPEANRVSQWTREKMVYKVATHLKGHFGNIPPCNSFNSRAELEPRMADLSLLQLPVNPNTGPTGREAVPDLATGPYLTFNSDAGFKKT